MKRSRLADLLFSQRPSGATGHFRTMRHLKGTPRSWTVGFAGVVFSAIALLATACGGGSGGSASAVAHLGTTTTTSSGAGAAASAGASTGGGASPAKIGADLMKFSSCMRSHGVPNFPNPVISGNSVSLQITPGSKGSPQFQKAAQDCQKYAPPGPTHVNLTTAQQADYLKAAECMRAHGINGFPDPDFSGGNVRFPLPQNMNPNTTQFEAARHICQNLIPNGLPYSSTDENP
jgi:hypothetical protein